MSFWTRPPAFTDPENEDKIQRSLMALSRGKTLLVYCPPAEHDSERRPDRGAGEGPYCGQRHTAGAAQPMPAISKAVAGPCGCPELGSWKGGLTMFRSMNRILRWTKGYHRRLYLGSLCSFLATWAAAGAGDAGGLGPWAGHRECPGGDGAGRQAPLAVPGRDHPADRSALRVCLLEKTGSRRVSEQSGRRSRDWNLVTCSNGFPWGISLRITWATFWLL